ncbi:MULTISPECIES: hypothetical protein [unclassified Bradyrhizobium]|uniref:hypothetical protein n=1 Tax=unclassified Bradyrhizobium TaxID=2631580 RepID=UPI001BA56343|nr:MULTISPECIES: hypothetical protein [unclassified Bradyrhizobium]MBR1202159.1 hypothetical protein [Bradyrhizobium sp. AUGA SZCCT0124]MBR1311272.1 hypothetical protein [Bradyrhizobium sp. AUGA SZCCT0051]MBR1339108.1 hypothetical protein [Bradyrhizobium sp. AUGA SZCCT0105]MBR1353682.1 hypothetical protein [Bradyrhizobium sp. AUGA SZCCT0045]
MVTPVGPLFAVGNQVVTKSGWRISYWVDAHNQQLQAAGQAPVYYWLPEQVNLARKPNGDYKFSMIHFAGVRSSGTTVGETSSDNEVAGGLINFATTAAPPDNVLADAHAALIDQVRSHDNPLWRYTSNQKPWFTFIPIVSNQCVLSNTLPGDSRGIPAVMSSKSPIAGAPPTIGLNRSYLPAGVMPRTVPQSYRGTNIDPMFVKLSGQGPGTIDPGAEKAYSALLGSIPAAVAYNGFHNLGTGVMNVTQNMMVRVVSPLMTIDITGHWSRIQDHFSGAGHAGGLFWSADIQAQYDSLRESGDIEVHTFVDQSLPGADKLQEYMDKRSDLIFQKFMDLAKQVIFDPAPFNEQPAQASGGFLGFGGGAAFKLREQRTNLDLEYHETKEIAYLQNYQVGGTLDGVADEIRANPAKDKVYFLTVDIGDWDRKVARVFKPVVNWPDPTQKWVGEPVAFLSCQVGYPNADGALQWDGHVFSPSDGPDAHFDTATFMKQKSDVAHPPAGWEPDKMFLKRQIHFTEPPSEFENPYARVQVEKDIVDLDPSPLGTPDNTIAVEVRVEEAGTLSVGPILLGANLTDDTQYVEVTMQALGKRDDGNDRDPVKFTFKFADQNTPRYWLVYTGQKNFVPKFQYSVRVVVKGTLFTHGQEWSTTTPISTGGSGGLMVTVPTPDDPNVTKKDVPLSAIASTTTGQGAPATPPPSTGHVVPPPSTLKPTAPPPTGKGAPGSGGYGEVGGWAASPGDGGASKGAPAPKDEVVFSSFEPA